ncbi:MAG: hypothetical protein GX933_06210 [Chloroflexi bacterium]|nr:hypothetical protein [Chloroflexota bacterium]
MVIKPLSIGADRFLSLHWVNYAYELSVSHTNLKEAQTLLHDYLATQIKGSESSRKTLNQLTRLWLTSNDDFTLLRMSAISFNLTDNFKMLPILHFGLSLNVFPIYKETVKVIGTLCHLTGSVLRKTVVDRVGEQFPNISSIPRNVNRVIQTITDWGLITNINGFVQLNPIPIDDDCIASWLLSSILVADHISEISLIDLTMNPLLLGISINEPRRVVQTAGMLSFHRNDKGLEVVKLNYVI